jgi:enoyl-CoA hydratase/carnithine racemase
MQHSKPVIVLLNGPALGGGVGLLFAADIRIGVFSLILCLCFVSLLFLKFQIENLLLFCLGL